MNKKINFLNCISVFNERKNKRNKIWVVVVAYIKIQK